MQQWMIGLGFVVAVSNYHWDLAMPPANMLQAMGGIWMFPSGRSLLLAFSTLLSSRASNNSDLWHLVPS